MSGLGLVISNLYGDIDRKFTFFCPLRYVFEVSVHFKVGRSSSRLCYVEKHSDGYCQTFLHKMSGLGLVISNLYGDIARKITFFCPLRYVFEASVHFKVGRSFSRLC